MKNIRSASLFSFFMFLSVAFFGQNSFSYAQVCQNDGSASPVLSPSFSGGGTFSNAGGLNVNSSTGVITLLPMPAAGTYTVFYTTTVVTSATIQILPLPIVSIAGNNTVCEQSAITLTRGGNAVTFTWSTGSNSSSIIDTPVSNPTTYTLTGAGANGCINTGIKTVSLIPVPTVSVVGNPTICFGSNLQLSASSFSSPATYSWSGPGLNATASVVNVTVNALGTSVFTLITTAQGCTNMAIHAVNAEPLPPISIVGTFTVCEKTAVTYSASGGISGSYIWNNNVVNNLDTFRYEPLTPNTVTLTLTGVGANGCAATASLVIPVKPKPNPSFNAPPVLCTGVSTVLVVQQLVANTNYVWSNGSTGPSVTLKLQQDSVITVVATNSAGCVGSASRTVTVKPTPTVTLNSPSVCRNALAVITATPHPSLANEPLVYIWPGGGSGPSYTTSSSAQQVLTVRLGSCSSTNSISVTVLPTTTAVANFSFPVALCTGNTLASPVFPSNFTKGGTFSPYFSSINVNSTTGEVDISSFSTGQYNVTYSVAQKDCVMSNSAIAIFFVNKSVQVTMEPLIEILPGESVRLTNSGGANSYMWSPATWLDCASCETPIATPLESQTYCVSSPQPCAQGSCVFVEILCIRSGDFSVPTAFTPNRDNNNDKYCLQGWSECNKEFNIKIVDRWGTLVFESSNPDFCWDGNYNGSPVPAGVYVYVINARFSKDPSFLKSGNITLIR